MKFLDSLKPAAYAFLRIAAGFMFLAHGAQKLFGVLGASPLPPGSQLWVGGVIELLGGTAVMLGVRTRWAAFLCSGTMAVAYCQYHWKFALGSAFFPIVNKGELAVLYCFVFFLIACTGGGALSLDKKG
jgi:putative oxidoreductase